MSNCNPIYPDRKSTAKNSARHAQLTPAEKIRRVAELRAQIHAPTFQARINAERGRGLP